MPSTTKIYFNIEPLKKLQREIDKDYITKVGVLGAKNARNGENTNAMIGAVHEFGSFTKNIPRRSWLKMPLVHKNKKLLNRWVLSVRRLLPRRKFKRMFEILGIEAESIIHRSFETKGFWQWKKITEQTARRKGSNQILIDTAQLRKSVTSKVEVMK